jgi:hypothetical protein
MVANPLDAGTGNNTVGKLFANVQGGPPVGLRVYTVNESTGLFRTAAVYLGAAGFSPATSADVEVPPGRGAFVFNPGAAGSAPLTLTFVGQVMQGNLSNPLPAGFSIVANQVPQAGKPDAFGLPGVAGDKIFRFNKATGLYFIPSTFAGSNPGQWIPPTPSIDVGEAFFLFRGAAGTWTRTFNVNNPS